MFKFCCVALAASIFLACTGRKKSSASVFTEYATTFNLIDHSAYTELQLKNSVTGVVERQYALVKKLSIHVPEGFEKIQIPVKRIIALSATHIGMLTALEARDAIVGCTDIHYVADEKIKSRIAERKVKSFSDESSIPVASVVDTKAQLIVYSGFGNEFPNESKLQLLGIHALADYDWQETDPLGRAEWIKVFGALLDKREEADKLFQRVKHDYLAVKQLVAGNRKQRQVISGSMFNGVWYAPGGRSYMSRLLADAGMKYLYKNNAETGSCERTFGQVLKETQNTAIWLNPGVATRKDLLKQNRRYKYLAPFQRGKIYCYTANANYFWEQSSLHPDWLLSDLAAIGGNLQPLKMYFYTEVR